MVWAKVLNTNGPALWARWLTLWDACHGVSPIKKSSILSSELVILWRLLLPSPFRSWVPLALLSFNSTQKMGRWLPSLQLFLSERKRWKQFSLYLVQGLTISKSRILCKIYRTLNRSVHYVIQLLQVPLFHIRYPKNKSKTVQRYRRIVRKKTISREWNTLQLDFSEVFSKITLTLMCCRNIIIISNFKFPLSPIPN